MSLVIQPSAEEFDSSKPQLVYARVINDLDTPVSAYLKIAKGKPYAFLFESVQGGEIRGRYSFLGFSPDVIWRANGDVNLPDPIGTPDAIMVRPTIVAIFDAVAQEIIVASPVYPGGSRSKAVERIEAVVRDLSLPTSHNVIEDIDTPVIEPKLGTTLSAFSDRVKKAKDYILKGDIFQVVIGQRLSAQLPASDFALYRSLRRMNPSPFLYFLNFEDHSIIGSSPEILVRLRDGVATIRPIAGTRPRGKTQAQDIQHEKDLLADPKECAEHLMLLDLGRNDVGRVSKAGTVRVTERFTVERYSHVMHIVSNVEGDILDEHDAISALFAGFPAGTVSGAPKVRAMEIIDELEAEKRGIYAGAVGYISSNGDMDTAIALRTGIVKDGTLHVRAGAGIVMDSVPKMEFEETLHKAAALFRAAEQSVKFDNSPSGLRPPPPQAG